jgi:L-glyceraldehyde 3-phosphate reductase
MIFNPIRNSGLQTPAISLGLWHNFGDTSSFSNMRALCRSAYDNGIVHFDIANNYGPPPGAAEESFGRILKSDLSGKRDHILISTKAGYPMWGDGPYQTGGSKKYLISSLDQSLGRLGIDYVDIFYHHRPDPSTPLEETVAAFEQILRSGKALYVAVSNYRGDMLKNMLDLCEQKGIRLLFNQIRHNLLSREAEADVYPVSGQRLSNIVFSPLAQGLLTDRYLNGVPDDSRIITDGRFLKKDQLSAELIDRLRELQTIAAERNQTLAQLSVSYLLSFDEIASVLVGVSKVSQLEDNVKALDAAPLSSEHRKIIQDLFPG